MLELMGYLKFGVLKNHMTLTFSSNGAVKEQTVTVCRIMKAGQDVENAEARDFLFVQIVKEDNDDMSGVEIEPFKARLYAM